MHVRDNTSSHGSCSWVQNCPSSSHRADIYDRLPSSCSSSWKRRWSWPHQKSFASPPPVVHWWWGRSRRGSVSFSVWSLVSSSLLMWYSVHVHGGVMSLQIGDQVSLMLDIWYVSVGRYKLVNGWMGEWVNESAGEWRRWDTTKQQRRRKWFFWSIKILNTNSACSIFFFQFGVMNCGVL